MMAERPQYVLELPEGYADLSEEDAARIQQHFNEASIDGALIVAPPGSRFRRIDADAPQAQMSRLLALLSLIPEERAFVQSALVGGDGEDFWKVFADYLEEKGVVGADRIRKTGPVSEMPIPEVQVRRQADNRIGVLRISLDLLENVLHFPTESRIDGLVFEPYVLCREIAFRVTDPGFREVETGARIPEVTLEYDLDEQKKVTTQWRV